LATSDGWFIAPPILSFSARRKRENAPCTVEERKRRGTTGARLEYGAQVRRTVPAAWLERGFWRLRNGRSSNSLSRLPRRSRQNCVYRFLFRPANTRGAPAERAAGPFHDIQTPARTTPRAESCVLVNHALRRAPVDASPCFSLLDRARPVFSFYSGNKKRKWGVQ